MPPLLTDKYPDLESELIPLVMQEIQPKNKARVAPKQYPEVYVSDTKAGLAIKCLESEKDAWLEKITPAFMELFKANNTPMLFGAEDYISTESRSGPPPYCCININVSLIELDRLLERESILWQKTGNRHALYEYVNAQGNGSSIPSKIIVAIDKTILEKEGYPVAYIVKPSNVFCLVCDAKGNEHVAKNFYDFYLLFEYLCKKHDIKLLPNATEYATCRTVPNTSIIKYEFNVSPADMEQLLLAEYKKYSGYRTGASISRLVDPVSEDLKDGVICLFPALLLADEKYMPRNTGCNMSELISVQLANYIKKYLLAGDDVPKEVFFGHHNSKLTEDFLGVGEQEIFDALAKCMVLNYRICHQSDGEGFRILEKSNTPAIKICDLDDDSIRLYQRHAVVTHVELEQLKSCEVPIRDFLDKLIEAVEDEVKSLSARDDLLTDKYIQAKIENAKKSILAIDELAAAIKRFSHQMKL